MNWAIIVVAIIGLSLLAGVALAWIETWESRRAS